MQNTLWQSGPNPAYDWVKDAQLDQWLNLNFGKEVFTPGLERIRFLANTLKWEHAPKAIITIAGTNGKGQTSHDLAYLLSENNASWSLWTSPHVLSVTERFKACGQYIERELLLELFTEMQQLGHQYNVKLSYYEFLFLCFLKWSSTLEIDYLILEVGLGGRLDAVNIFNADIVLLPSISRDHTAILGNTLKKILYEKLGVTRPGHKLFHTLEQVYLRCEVDLYCKKHGVEIIDLWPIVKEQFLEQSYVKRNRLLAKQAATSLLRNIKIPNKWPTTGGRQDYWRYSQGSFLFTGSHNLDGHRKFISHTIESTNIEGKGPHGTIFDRVFISFSDRPINEVEAIIDLYLLTPGFCHELLVSPFNHPKAMDVKKHYLLWSQRWGSRLRCLEQWNVAIEECLVENLNFMANKKLLITGSYYFVGEIQKHLLSHYPNFFNIDYTSPVS
jgi:dihydrofolate synthase/folylpolyglutamate synthase